MNESFDERRILAITRPDRRLLTQYFLHAAMSLILFPIVFPPLLIKYLTLRYRFDSEGVGMQWGFLFRREINLTYARIQDIHLSRGVIERWLGIATLSIQTASGSAAAEMAIQGLREHEQVRDFLYSRMRGWKRRGGGSTPETAQAGRPEDGEESEALVLLREIHAEIRALRAESAGRPPSQQPGGDA